MTLSVILWRKGHSDTHVAGYLAQHWHAGYMVAEALIWLERLGRA